MAINRKAVIFDMDGVIFDSEVMVLDCWSRVAEKYGILNIEGACRECLGVNAVYTREKFKQRYGQDFPYDRYKKEMSALFHQREQNGELEMKPGIVELLAYLKEKNYKIGVASSTRQEVVEQELLHAGLRGWFDDIVGGDTIQRSKSEPDIYLLACKRLGIMPEEAYGIEDSYNGVLAVYRAGMHPIMVPDLLPPNAEMKALCEVICNSLSEVKEFLKNIQKSI